MILQTIYTGMMINGDLGIREGELDALSINGVVLISSWLVDDLLTLISLVSTQCVRLFSDRLKFS